MKTVSIGLFLLMIIGYSSAISATCILSASTASFGTVTSFSIGSTISSTSTTASVNCTSALFDGKLSASYFSLSLLSASHASNSRALMKRTGDTGNDTIPVQLCITPSCATEMTLGESASTLKILPLTHSLTRGNYNFVIPLYLKTLLPGQPVAAGTYKVKMTLAASYRICTDAADRGSVCLSSRDSDGSDTIPLSVKITVTNDCITLSAPDISFGSAPLVSQFSAVSQSISVSCTKGSGYSVGLSYGSHAVGNKRNMANGSHLLSYDIYKGNSNNRWGPMGTERLNSSSADGVSSNGIIRYFNYTAKILSAQNTPAAGSYSDIIVVDLSF